MLCSLTLCATAKIGFISIVSLSINGAPLIPIQALHFVRAGAETASSAQTNQEPYSFTRQWYPIFFTQFQDDKLPFKFTVRYTLESARMPIFS